MAIHDLFPFTLLLKYLWKGRKQSDHQKPMKSFNDTIQTNANFLEEILLTLVYLGKIKKTIQTREIKQAIKNKWEQVSSHSCIYPYIQYMESKLQLNSLIVSLLL